MCIQAQLTAFRPSHLSHILLEVLGAQEGLVGQEGQLFHTLETQAGLVILGALWVQQRSPPLVPVKTENIFIFCVQIKWVKQLSHTKA